MNCAYRSLWTLIAANLISIAAAFAAPADLDLSFGSSGVFRRALSTSDDLARSIAVQQDGKIIVAALCESGNQIRICLTRLTAEGVLDTAFAQQGVATTLIATTFESYAVSIAIAEDSKIVISTACAVPSASSTGLSRFCVARFNSNGSPDTNFGTMGVVTTLMSVGATPKDAPTALFIRPNGTITVTGTCQSNDDPSGSGRRLCTARYLPQSGELDATYGNGGIAFHTNAAWTAGRFEGIAATMAPSGAMWIAGQCTIADLSHGCVVATTSNGALATGFGTQGLQALNFGNQGTLILAIALQRDGKLVLGAFCARSTDTFNPFCLARISSTNGALDTTFSEGFLPSGVVRTRMTPYTFANVQRLAIDDDGAILAVGICSGGAVPASAMCIARYRPEGYLDTSFSASGTRAPVLNEASYVYDVLKHRGRILIAGACDQFDSANNDTCVVALQGGPFTYARCSLDIDGDGAIRAEIDGLMWSRAMLGFDIAQIIGSINFAASAVRNSALAIRQFLNEHCGMEVRQ